MNTVKIAVVGCGALGSFYGARLCRLPRARVHFLLRSDYDAVRARGVRVLSPEGNFTAFPACARQPEEIGVCDWVLIGLKTTANAGFARLLTPLVGPRTAVLTLQNGLGNEEQLAALFGPEHVLGGLCFVCINREQPGVIRHIAHGRIVLGEFQRPVQPRTRHIVELLRDGGTPCEATDNLEAAHWEKLVWNIPFNGLGVAGTAGYDAVLSGRCPSGFKPGPCLDTDVLLSDPRWLQQVRELMREVIRTAQTIGLPVADESEEQQIRRTLDMGAYRASTLIDFERGLPLELESLFLEPLRRAQRAGVETPRLRNLCAVLQTLDAAHDGQERPKPLL